MTISGRGCTTCADLRRPHEKGIEMKKIAAALVALVVTMAGLTGAAVSSSTAAQEHPTYTKRLVLHEIASAGLGTFSFAGTDRIRSRATNNVLGFVSYSGVFHPRTETVTLWASLALRGGLIHGRVKLTDDDRFTGTITGGAGKYRGITGTISGRSASGNRTFVNLHYALPG
jgi:hypothetical protein